MNYNYVRCSAVSDTSVCETLEKDPRMWSVPCPLSGILGNWFFKHIVSLVPLTPNLKLRETPEN